ncbi:hypothetical protein PHMEG_00015328 [Phytophthora megakarya]|uniref:Uncharacterized protein n=1 Tax=Phytophthora megakarya TaxID=4795 RepID=A0A225W2L1_9STRA|nr:hypothetical protein PHMEG_00015328 [Phytophthora megakarya]
MYKIEGQTNLYVLYYRDPNGVSPTDDPKSYTAFESDAENDDDDNEDTSVEGDSDSDMQLPIPPEMRFNQDLVSDILVVWLKQPLDLCRTSFGKA